MGRGGWRRRSAGTRCIDHERCRRRPDLITAKAAGGRPSRRAGDGQRRRLADPGRGDDRRRVPRGAGAGVLVGPAAYGRTRGAGGLPGRDRRLGPGRSAPPASRSAAVHDPRVAAEPSQRDAPPARRPHDGHPHPHPRRLPRQRHRRRRDRRLRHGRRRLAHRAARHRRQRSRHRRPLHLSARERPGGAVQPGSPAPRRRDRPAARPVPGTAPPSGPSGQRGFRPRAPDRSGTPPRSRAVRPGPPGRSSRTRCRTRGRGSRCPRRPWWPRRRRSRSGASR